MLLINEEACSASLEPGTNLRYLFIFSFLPLGRSAGWKCLWEACPQRSTKLHGMFLYYFQSSETEASIPTLGFSRMSVSRKFPTFNYFTRVKKLHDISEQNWRGNNGICLWIFIKFGKALKFGAIHRVDGVRSEISRTGKKCCWIDKWFCLETLK